MPAVSTSAPYVVSVDPGWQVMAMNNGGLPLYYQAASTGSLSTTTYDGILNSGSWMICRVPMALLAGTAGASVDLAAPARIAAAPIDKVLVQLAIIAEMLAQGLQPTGGSLDYPSSTAGL